MAAFRSLARGARTGNALFQRNMFKQTAMPAVSFQKKFVNRNFHSTQPKCSAAPAAAAPAAAIDSEKGIIDTYGLYPLLGLGFTALVSKEMFLLNEEFLLALDISAFVATGYVLLGDQVSAWFKSQEAARVKYWDETWDLLIEGLNVYKNGLNDKKLEVDFLKQFLKEYKEGAVAHTNYLNVKPRHAAAADVLARLEQIKNREEVVAAEAATKMIDDAVASVYATFAKDSNLRNKSLDNAIEFIGQKGTPKDDPVLSSFKNVLSK